MKLATGSDHAGFELKTPRIACLGTHGRERAAAGTHGPEPAGIALAQELVSASVRAAFIDEERHVKRLNEVRAPESTRAASAKGESQ